MGLDFLRNFGAQRMARYDEQPFLLTDGVELTETDEKIDLDHEAAREAWAPIRVDGAVPDEWPLRPARYVDGKDVGRTVAWLRGREGHPIPVRLSEIGAVVMRDVGGRLRREFDIVERVVTMMIDPFPWDEVESFAAALKQHGFRLLAAEIPSEGLSYDFERMRKRTQNGSMQEMLRIEKQALARESALPTVVDGRLDPRAGSFDDRTQLAVGVIKTRWQQYLHARGWQVYYDLAPGERTPAFALECHNLHVLTWYLRLDGSQGEMPNWGIIRVEVPKRFRVDGQALGSAEIDYLSRLLCDERCRDDSYGRAAVSIEPIQRAEESLGALFTTADALIQHFYHLTHIE
jgi:hypothetical protein